MAASGAVSAMTSQFSRAEDVTKAQNVTKTKNVVLVHGLYADGSSWLDVIAHLQTAGLNATAVQNPLMSLEEDSAAVRRILAQQDGPTVADALDRAAGALGDAFEPKKPEVKRS
jgi:hypothetical protein